MAKINVITPNNLGKGIKKNETSKKWEVDLTEYVDGSSISVTPEGKLASNAKSGLDCEAIEELPIVAWKKDTVVLAKQDGRCVRLKPSGDIFTDIVVDFAAAKSSIELGKGKSETVNLIATITNAGTNAAKEIFVTITKPQLGTYQVGNITTNNIGETKTGELTWKIPTLDSGKTLAITIPVTLSTIGSFIFGLQATSTLDTNPTNNTKTFTFAVTSKNEGDNTNYVPTGEDCPLIIATDLTHNQRLNVMTTGTDEHFSEFGKYINVFADGRGFAGKKIKLEGASTVVVSYADAQWEPYRTYMSARDYSNTNYGKITSTALSIYNGNSYSPSQGLVITSTSMGLGTTRDNTSNASPIYLRDMGTFDPQTQIFTFHSNLQLPTRTSPAKDAPYNCVIWCRPGGKDCKWQGIPIVLGIKDNIDFTKRYEFAKVKGNVTDVFSNELPPSVVVDPDFIKAANFVGGEKPKDLIATRNALSTEENEIAAQHTVTVIQGEEAKFTIRATGRTNNLSKYIATGKTSTSYDASTKTLTVTVAADAKPTDSIYWDDLRIIIK